MIALIGILVVAASPTFVNLMRDRRVNRAAMHLVDSYRTGRTRAMGRGQPVLVEWNPTAGLSSSEPGSQGLVRIIEPLVAPNTASATCQTAQWETPAMVQELSRVDFKSGAYTYTNATMFDDAPTPSIQSFTQICFAPSGATFIRTAPATAFRRMSGVASFTVANSATGVVRTVFIPPNGVARLQL